MARKKASFSSFLFGVLFGIIIVLGSVAYGGYWAYNNLSVNEFERLTGQQLTFLAQDSMLRTKAIKDLISEAQAIPEMKFSDFTDVYGITFPAEVGFITTALGDIKIKELSPNHLLERVKIGYVLGAPYNDFEYEGERPEDTEALMWEFRTYTIMGENGIQTYIDALTLGSVKNVFGLELPSFLALDDDIFLSEMGSAIDNLYVSDFLENLVGEGTLTDSLSNTIFNTLINMEKDDDGTLRPYKLSEFGEMFNELPSEIYIKDIISEPDESDDSPVAAVLRKLIKDPVTENYYKLSEINNVFDNLGNTIYISDIISEPDETDNSPVAQILRKVLKDAETGTYYTLNEINTVFDGLGDDILLRDIITEPEPLQPGHSNSEYMAFNIINKLRNMEKAPEQYYTINEINIVLTLLPNEIKISEIMTTDGLTPGTIGYNIVNHLITLKDDSNNDYTIGNINEALDKLPNVITLAEIMSTDGLTPGTTGYAIVDKLINLKDDFDNPYTIGNISEAIDQLPTVLLLRDIIHTDGLTVGTPSYNIADKIRNLKDDGGTDEYYTLDQIGIALGRLPDVLTLKDVMDAPSQTDIFGKIMYKLWSDDIAIADMKNGLNDDDFELRDVFLAPTGDTLADRIIGFIISEKADDPGEYYKLSEINDAFNDITMGVLFSDSPSIMCIFEPNTKLSDIGSVNIAAVLGGKTLGELVDNGIMAPVHPDIRHKTLDELITQINYLAQNGMLFF